MPDIIGPNGPVPLDAAAYDFADLNTRLTAALAAAATERPFTVRSALNAARKPVGDVAPVVPTVSVSTSQTVPEGNSGPTVVTVTVTRSETGASVQVPYTIDLGSMNATDFTGGTAPTGGNVTIPAGALTGTVSFSINGDTTVETNESFSMTIAPPSGYAAGARMTTTLNITNDDVAAGTPAIAFSSSSASVTEGNSGTKTVTNTINITRNGVTGPLTVNLSYAGTGQNGVDFTAPTSGTVGDGISQLIFDVLVNGDTTVEPDETIIINASLSGYSSTASKTITITNDDVAAPVPYHLDDVTQAPVMSIAGARTSSAQTTPVASVAIGTGTPFDVSSAAEAQSAGATKLVSLYSGADAITFNTRLDIAYENDRIIGVNNGTSAVQAPIPASILSTLNGATGFHAFLAIGGIKAATSGSEIFVFVSSDTSGTVPIFQMSRNTSQRLQAAFRRLQGDSSTLTEAGGLPGVTMPSFELFDAGIDYNTGGTRTIRVGRTGADNHSPETANTDTNTLPGAPASGYISVPPSARFHSLLLFRNAPTYSDIRKVRRNAKRRAADRYLQQNDGAATWWTRNASKHPALPIVWVGSTNGMGMFYINEYDANSRGMLDVECAEPRKFTVDEHQSVAVAHTPAGVGLIALGAHSNGAPNATQQDLARVRIIRSSTGKLVDIAWPAPFGAGVSGTDYFDYFLSNTSTTAGTNYGQWDIISENNWLLWVNNDNRADWRSIRFTNGNLAAGVKNRPLLGGTIQSGGQAQTYDLFAKLSTDVRRHFVQFHPSNLRNIIYGVDVNITTGRVFSDATEYGNLYDGDDTMSPIVNFASGSLVLPKVIYDPGADNSVRLLDAYEDTILAVVFKASDGSNARHIEVDGNGNVTDLGPAGAYFGGVFPGPYYCGLMRARESHSGKRFYRCFNDGAVAGEYGIERIDIASPGATPVRTRIDTAPAGTDKILRPLLVEGANDNFVGVYTRGAYGDFRSFRNRMQPFAASGL